MLVDINSRGNGACPLCAADKKCRIQDTMVSVMTDFVTKDNPMELVVYSCPQFQEKSE